MNKHRRAIIFEHIQQLETIKGSLNNLCSIEEAAFENLPESLQQAPQGEKISDALSALEDALSNVDDAIELLTTATA